MSSLKLQARRATLDDLPRLKSLWTLMQFNPGELERHLTDFQVVVDTNGLVIGAIALQIFQRHGHIHSESFEDFSLTDPARPALWERLQTLATNHGLVRLWTREQAPFWSHNGFAAAPPEILEKMPASWNRTHSDWLTLKLKDDEAIASLEKEFSLFVESEKQQRSQLLGQAKALKTVMLTGVVLIAILFVAAMIWLLLRQREGGVSLPQP